MFQRGSHSRFSVLFIRSSHVQMQLNSAEPRNVSLGRGLTNEHPRRGINFCSPFSFKEQSTIFFAAPERGRYEANSAVIWKVKRTATFSSLRFTSGNGTILLSITKLLPLGTRTRFIIFDIDCTRLCYYVTRSTYIEREFYTNHALSSFK